MLPGWGTSFHLFILCLFSNPHVDTQYVWSHHVFSQFVMLIAVLASPTSNDKMAIKPRFVSRDPWNLVPCALCYEEPQPKKMFSRCAMLTWNVVNSWSFEVVYDWIQWPVFTPIIWTKFGIKIGSKIVKAMHILARHYQNTSANFCGLSLNY